MNSYYEILDVCRTSLKNNVDINTVIVSDLAEPNDYKHIIFPLGYIDCDNGRFEENVSLDNVKIQVLDQVVKSNKIVTDKWLGQGKVIDVLTTTKAVLRRTYDELVRDLYDVGIKATIGTDYQKVKNESGDVQGWEMTLELEVPNTQISTG